MSNFKLKTVCDYYDQEPMPCLYTHCRYHLGFAGKETCSLIVADRGPQTQEQMMEATGWTVDQVKKYFGEALKSLKAKFPTLGQFWKNDEDNE
jgi:hypothetical protein